MTSAHHQRNGITTSLQQHRNTSLVCDFSIFHSSHRGPFPWRISFRMAFGVFFRLSVSRFTDPRERKAPHRYPRRFSFRGGELTPWGRTHCHRAIDIRTVMKWVLSGFEFGYGYEARGNGSVVRIYDTPPTRQTYRCCFFWPQSPFLNFSWGLEGRWSFGRTT